MVKVFSYFISKIATLLTNQFNLSPKVDILSPNNGVNSAGTNAW